MRRMKMLSARASFQDTEKPLWKVQGVSLSGLGEFVGVAGKVLVWMRIGGVEGGLEMLAGLQ